MLKVFFPDHESLQEADALERWDGDGAIRLLARDDERCALLLERCEPGAFLSSIGGEPALDVLIELLPRLWKSGDGFHTLADEASGGSSAASIRGSRLRRSRAQLASSQGEQVLVHQDLHGDNVLAAEREPWLVIDPKPLAGEREFAVAPIVRSGELGHSKRDVLLPARPALRRARARPRACARLDDRADARVVARRDRIESHLEVVEWLR